MKNYLHLKDLFEVEKMKPEDLSRLFFFSLFEYEFFFQKDFRFKTKELRKGIFKIVKEFGKPFIKKPRVFESLFSSHFLTGKITNLILAYEINKTLRKKVAYPNRKKDDFDVDLELRMEKHILIEIKRILSFGNIANYILDFSKKIEKLKRFKGVIVLIFLVEGREIPFEENFFFKVTDGFRNFFSKFQNSEIIPKNIYFFTYFFSRKSDLKSFIEEFIKLIKERVVK